MRRASRLIPFGFVILLLNLLLLLQPSAVGHSLGASCQTPEKSEGRCVHLSSCRLVLRHYAMYKEHMPPAIMRFLQRARCKPKNEGYHLCCELKDVIPANANSKLK
ncbi:uncharacterized protein LOC6536971 [Drosophila yakuba]|uniref:Clip domain-containing protein n=1 Tax=Drosophila yakuba TaxID=7245 RepID=B4PQF6_DROYA|nr:uncharacterized protein LOC6536971 [Drosophila yakuba]EDW97252.1 uncharacterized protein Dyak_GE24434 [Drosophila yakuba]